MLVRKLYSVLTMDTSNVYGIMKKRIYTLQGLKKSTIRKRTNEPTIKNSISNDICMCGNAFRSDTYMDVQSRTVATNREWRV